MGVVGQQAGRLLGLHMGFLSDKSLETLQHNIRREKNAGSPLVPWGRTQLCRACI